MPTYEFKCPQGHVFDKFFSTISGSLAELPCPECGETAARQISGGAGLQFKGSGFYLTDYGKNAHRSSGSSKPASAESKGDSKGEGKASEAKASEAKPAESKPTGTSSGGGSKSGGGAPA